MGFLSQRATRIEYPIFGTELDTRLNTEIEIQKYRNYCKYKPNLIYRLDFITTLDLKVNGNMPHVWFLSSLNHSCKK